MKTEPKTEEEFSKRIDAQIVHYLQTSGLPAPTSYVWGLQRYLREQNIAIVKANAVPSEELLDDLALVVRFIGKVGSNDDVQAATWRIDDWMGKQKTR